ncbi:Uncharacterised protein [Sphingobacterium daejeonense]|nr:Uncharacterised protein [Sphingobacterium daejeonense]
MAANFTVLELPEQYQENNQNGKQGGRNQGLRCFCLRFKLPTVFNVGNLRAALFFRPTICWISSTALTILVKRKQNVTATIYTKAISNQLQLDIKRYNSQYLPIEIKVFSDTHDRFLIIDQAELYHIGASLKDLGKKWFAFSRMDIEVGRMLHILNKQ